ncbi:MAG: hypothetical protein AAFR61_13755 [Bacteroidota bacterium]
MASQTFEHAIKSYFSEGIDHYLPHLSINCVVWGYTHPELRVLVARISSQGDRMLPGGYIKHQEKLEEAANRNLALLGIEQVYLRQIQTFGDPQRITDPRISAFAGPHLSQEILTWITQRFITVVYYGLVDIRFTDLKPGGLGIGSEWIPLSQLEGMFLDHEEIIVEARKILAKELLHQPIAAKLLPGPFTLGELRGLYEAILDREIDRGTFRRKMLKQGLIEKVGQKKEASRRPPDLFTFNMEAYQESLKGETKFGF